MKDKFYYCILKNSKGVFKKKFLGNTHLFFIPLGNDTYGYFGLIGEMLDDNDKPLNKHKYIKDYACTLLSIVPSDIVNDIIYHQVKLFKGRFKIVEELDCIYYNSKIKIFNKGSFIKSSLEIFHLPEYSTLTKKIYKLVGFLNFSSDEFTLSKKNVERNVSKDQFTKLLYKYQKEAIK
jgi:hypothetical protein